MSLEDLVQSFDQTINACFSAQEQQPIVDAEEVSLASPKFVLSFSLPTACLIRRLFD